MRRLVIALLVLVGLLVAADFGAAALAESAVSRQMREQIGLADDPAVRINGFSFLLQALSGEYSSVDVDAERIKVGDLQELEVSAHLTDVTAPLSMLLGSGPKTLRAQEAEGTVRVSAGDLERIFPIIDKLRIDTVDEDVLQQAIDDGAEASVADINPTRAARLVGKVAMLGSDEIAVLAVLELSNGQARIVPRDIRFSDGTPLPIPKEQLAELEKALTRPVNTGALPLQITPTRFRAREGMLELTGTAKDLVLGEGSTTSSG